MTSTKAGVSPAPGGEVDDHLPVFPAGGGAGEQRPFVLAERQAAGRDGRHADEPPDPVRRLQQHVLDRDAAHRVPDQREPVPAEVVGQGDRVGGGLGHRVRARLPAARPVAAQIGEHVGEIGGVQVLGEVAPAARGAEPAVQGEDVMVPRSDRDVRATHGT